MTETPTHHEPSGARDYAAAIYGSIVATAIVGALRETDVSASELTVDVFATVVVFWLAHSWAAIAGERIHTGHRLSVHRVRALAREEWPMVEAGFGPVFALVLGWIGVLDEDDAARLAIGIGVVQLFAWGFVLGRRVYDTWFGAVLAGLGNGALGVVLVLLEIAVSH
jgi:hypothetical protein